jgi:acyl-CoA thioesterase FadM
MIMSKKPITFRTTRRATFDDLDPYGHMNTSRYVAAFLEHRFDGLREVLGLGLAALAELPFSLITRRISVDFVKSIRGDEPFEIISHVAVVSETDCEVWGEMHDARGALAARFQLGIACVSKASRRPCAWPEGFMERFFLEGAPADSATDPSGQSRHVDEE